MDDQRSPVVNYVRCNGCAQPVNCDSIRQCQTTAHWLDHYRYCQLAPTVARAAPTTVPTPPPTNEGLNKIQQKPSIRTSRTDADMNTTTQQQIAADVAFAKENSDEIRGIAATIRYVAALHPEVTKAAFVAAMVDLGYNRSTVGIQFAESRRVSLECGDVELLVDGRLVDKA